MSENDGVRLRLPGLFRWAEVCDVFLGTASEDEEFRFVAKPHSVTAELEVLYVVEAVAAARRVHGRERLAALPG